MTSGVCRESLSAKRPVFAGRFAGDMHVRGGEHRLRDGREAGNLVASGGDFRDVEQ